MGANASSHLPYAPDVPTPPPPTRPPALSPGHDAPRGSFLPEIVELLAECLVGYDVLQLSHVCRAFRLTLTTPNVWRDRIGSSPRKTVLIHRAWCAEQTAYFRLRSLRFRGLDALPPETTRRLTIFDKMIKPKQVATCGDAYELPFMLLPEENGRLSFDLWFSLLPTATPTASGGGILFGLQSHSCFTPHRTPHHVDRFVQVDPQRNLYCSVLVGKPVVAHELDVNRWYHVALVFNGHGSAGISKPQSKWHWTRHAQVGTGYIAESSRGKPTPSFAGWYPFHGLLDDCRVWHEVLSDEEIQQLASHKRIAPTPVFQLSSDQLQRSDGVERVKCSRPMERRAELQYPRVRRVETTPRPRPRRQSSVRASISGALGLEPEHDLHAR